MKGEAAAIRAMSRKLALLYRDRNLLRNRIGAYRVARQEAPDLQFQVKEIETAISHLEGALKIFRPDWTSSSVKPARPYTKQSPLPWGNLTLEAKAVMRERGAPLTVEEIWDGVCQRRNLDSSMPYRDQAIPVLRSILARLREKGRVVSTGRPAVWSLKPKASVSSKRHGGGV